MMASLTQLFGSRLGQRTGGFAKRPVGRLLVLAILLAGLFGAVPAAQVRANAPVSGNVTLRLTIEQVEDVFFPELCFDSPTISLDCGSPPDSYPIVSFVPGSVCTPVAPATIDNDEENVRGCRAPAIIDEPVIAENWQFDATVAYGQVPSLPLSIQIFDADGGARFDDDKADISPLVNTTGLSLQVDLTTTPCTIRGAGGGPCSQAITVEGSSHLGNKENLAKIIYRVDVLNPLPDTDGDAIPNTWEQFGVTIDPDGDGGVAPERIDLPAMGAEWDKPDIFVQLD
jgi:hypothetical protein